MSHKRYTIRKISTPRPTMRKPYIYSFLRSVINFLIPLVARLEVHGWENLPRSGGYITAANHLGRMDIPLVYYLLDRDDVILLVAEKYRKYGIVRWLVKQLDALWLDRFASDVHALRSTLDRLKAGGVLVIAPEGTRSPTGALIAGKAGSSYLAAKSGLPVIPVAATGTEDALVLKQLKNLRRLNISVYVGTPFYISPLNRGNREAALQEATDEIMCRIASMLPEAYRGVYADHPRLTELLQENGNDAVVAQSSAAENYASNTIQ
jgi:1-acyl-sn-glycerol-3-phosphate acyltransferase